MPESLIDIARKLNVAPSTVSRAISAPDKVAAKTRQKILNYIKETGYHPNISARNLRKQQSKTIGIVVNDLCDSLIAQAANIMQDIAFKRGYFPVLLSTDESRTKERESIERLLVLNVCGVVIIPSSTTASLLDHFNHIPVVELDRSTSTCKNDEFRMDDTAAMQMATSYLKEQGCKHLSVIFGNIDRISSFKSRHLALLNCTQELEYNSYFIKGVNAQDLIDGARKLTNTIIESNKNFSVEEIGSDLNKEVAQLLLESSDNPAKITGQNPIDGFIAANHSIAAGIVQGFYDQGLEVNKDLKVFTFDNPDWISILPYKMPSLTHPLVKAADLAINRLIDRIEHKYSDNVEARLLRPQLCVDKSSQAQGNPYQPLKALPAYPAQMALLCKPGPASTTSPKGPLSTSQSQSQSLIQSISWYWRWRWQFVASLSNHLIASRSWH